MVKNLNSNLECCTVVLIEKNQPQESEHQEVVAHPKEQEPDNRTQDYVKTKIFVCYFARSRLILGNLAFNVCFSLSQ